MFKRFIIFKKISYICVFMNLLTSRRWIWSRGMLSSPLQAEDTTACRPIENINCLSYWEQGLGEWGSEPSRSKCKRRSYSFPSRILTKLFELKEEFLSFFFFFYTKSMAGIVILQKLGKALVHRGDGTINMFLYGGEEVIVFKSWFS